jgi:hypothetical protein
MRHPKRSEIQSGLLHLRYSSRLKRKTMRYQRRKRCGTFYQHMNHLKCYDGGKVQEKFERKCLGRPRHPVYSPRLSPCDFWFFGMAKGKRRILNFTQFMIFSAVWQKSRITSFSKTANLCSLNGRPTETRS